MTNHIETNLLINFIEINLVIKIYKNSFSDQIYKYKKMVLYWFLNNIIYYEI